MQRLILLLLIGNLFFYCNAQTSYDYFKRAEYKFQLHDYRRGIADLDTAIIKNPSESEYYLLNGIYKAKIKDEVGEMKIYDSAIANCKIETLSDIYQRRGYLKDAQEDYNGAITDYNMAISINPKDDYYYYLRAYSKHQLHDYIGAIADCNLAIEINSKESYWYNFRGNIKSMLNDYRGAIVDFTKAILIDPKGGGYYCDRGESKFELKDYKSAIVDFNMAILIDPKNKLSFYKRGLSKIRVGIKESGCLDLSKAGELGIKSAYEMIKKYCN